MNTLTRELKGDQAITLHYTIRQSVAFCNIKNQETSINLGFTFI